MYLHRSNRTEALVDALAEVVSRPLADACAPECIVVQGRGMERWLSMRLAARFGVWANPDFPFPRHLILRVLRAVLDVDEQALAVFEPEVLRWSIAAQLPQHLERPEFDPIRHYLADDANAQRRLQLAERIAHLFDQYVVYRPQMLRDWERGRDTHWQAILWRELIARHGAAHVAARAGDFLEALQNGTPRLASFPARVSVFGVSTLAPLYVQMLAALARHVELHLFLPSPSAEYWAEIRSQRELLRSRKGVQVPSDVEAEARRAEGNPLLASLGRVGRDFQEILEELVDYQEDGRAPYLDPGTATMLATLQADMLALRSRGTGTGQEPPLRVSSADDSIVVHACHSPMREVEVLHDQLLALFERDLTLRPRHVIVMAPLIDAYAPFIDAVFGGAGDDAPRIPYRIADRAVRATDDDVAAFLAVLTTLRGRLAASEVLDVLALQPVRRQFGFAADDLDQLRSWIRESGIRWAVDETHRAEEGQPPLRENTWRFGLDRLLLGYAAPGEGRRLYAGVLPYDDVEGSDAEVLGRLAAFCARLFEFHRALQTPRTIAAWERDLGTLLSALLASTDDTAYQHRAIRAALAELREAAAAGSFDEEIDLESIHAQLTAALERGAPGRAFLSGGVTFCAMVPMRSIPFRVVCLIGMNDADFPRVRRPLSFDLMAQHPLRGDRTSRDDDRYLFLEALLSARQRLLITYVGQSVRDNNEIPPSVVVSELLDAMNLSFCTADADDTAPRAPATSDSGYATRERFIVRHPLQPFSPSYFRVGGVRRLVSYAKPAYEGACALTGERQVVPPFVSAPLPHGSATNALSLDALARFFENPTRAFLQGRLDLYLGGDVDTVDDREPLALDPLQRWKLGDESLTRALRDEAIAPALPALRASGALPPGTLGEEVFERLHPQVAALAARAHTWMQGTAREPLVVERDLDGIRITGVIGNLWPDAQVRCQYSKLGGRHELALWIRHLVLNWLHPDNYPRTTILIGRRNDDAAMAVRFTPVDEAQEILRALLRLHALGQRAPLLLFPEASRAYAETCRRGGAENTSRALERAHDAYGKRYEAQDPYVRQVFATMNPLGIEAPFGDPELPGLADVALAVFTPLLEHREELP